MTDSLSTQLNNLFLDDSLLSNTLHLKNLNHEGYISLDVLSSSLSSSVEDLQDAIKSLDNLILHDDQMSVKRASALSPDVLAASKKARCVVAYNLTTSNLTTEDVLRKKFSTCGEIASVQVISNGLDQHNAKAFIAPPVTCAGSYAIIEFTFEECASHAVLTLSDTDDWRNGLQVVLADGTHADSLKQKLFPESKRTLSRSSSVVSTSATVDRRRAKSVVASTVSPLLPPTIVPEHIDAVGEGLSFMKDGKGDEGTVFSIRGQGGLINPDKCPEASISFRLVPADNEETGLQAGDRVTFVVGRNRKSGRKYASKVKFVSRPEPEMTTTTRPRRGSQLDNLAQGGFSGTSWMSRRRSSTLGEAAAANTDGDSTTTTTPTALMRRMSSSSTTNPPSMVRRMSSSNSNATPPPVTNSRLDFLRSSSSASNSESTLQPPPLLRRKSSTVEEENDLQRLKYLRRTSSIAMPPMPENEADTSDNLNSPAFRYAKGPLTNGNRGFSFESSNTKCMTEDSAIAPEQA